MHHRPVIGSDIGGTAEKIDGYGGLKFTAHSESALAGVMKKALGNTALHQALKSQIQAPHTSRDCTREPISLYRPIIEDF